MWRYLWRHKSGEHCKSYSGTQRPSLIYSLQGNTFKNIFLIWDLTSYTKFWWESQPQTLGHLSQTLSFTDVTVWGVVGGNFWNGNFLSHTKTNTKHTNEPDPNGWITLGSPYQARPTMYQIPTMDNCCYNNQERHCTLSSQSNYNICSGTLGVKGWAEDVISQMLKTNVNSSSKRKVVLRNAELARTNTWSFVVESYRGFESEVKVHGLESKTYILRS